jgi:hypothetical protein
LTGSENTRERSINSLSEWFEVSTAASNSALTSKHKLKRLREFSDSELDEDVIFFCFTQSTKMLCSKKLATKNDSQLLPLGAISFSSTKHNYQVVFLPPNLTSVQFMTIHGQLFLHCENLEQIFAAHVISFLPDRRYCRRSSLMKILQGQNAAVPSLLQTMSVSMSFRFLALLSTLLP